MMIKRKHVNAADAAIENLDPNTPTKPQKRQQRNATSEILAEPSTSSNAAYDQQPLKSLLLQINLRRQLASRQVP